MGMTLAPTALEWRVSDAPVEYDGAVRAMEERVAAIRAAFVKTMNDPRFVGSLKKQNLDLDPIPAADIEKVVRRLYAMPESVKEAARELMPK